METSKIDRCFSRAVCLSLRWAPARAAPQRASFRTKSSWRVDLLANGLTVHDRHGLASRASLWLRWNSLGRRRWRRGRGGSRRRNWLCRRWGPVGGGEFWGGGWGALGAGGGGGGGGAAPPSSG